DDYLEMIRLKTAVLLGASMKMGALIGGAGEKNRNLLYDIGEKAGLAFQVQDDLLDTYGNEQEFGKEIGRDIQENKMTFLLVNALQYADTSLRNELLKWLATSRHKEEKRKAVTEIFDKLNIRRLATEKINEYFISALSSLEKVDTREDKKKNIKDFIKKLMSRSR
ncbi:MAG: polyprenyl synthetase family protein, partial [Bacteroidota bacterium]